MTLEWKHMPLQGHPDGAWRLIATPATMALLGGAPCLSEALRGQVAYVLRDRGRWYGRAELTPYHSQRTQRRMAADTAKADVLALVEAEVERVRAALPPVIDIQASHLPSFLIITPTTGEGSDWCADHINALPIAGSYHAEHRYGPDILLAAHNAGLTVALDGQVADVPREG